MGARRDATPRQAPVWTGVQRGRESAGLSLISVVVEPSGSLVVGGALHSFGWTGEGRRRASVAPVVTELSLMRSFHHTCRRGSLYRELGRAHQQRLLFLQLQPRGCHFCSWRECFLGGGAKVDEFVRCRQAVETAKTRMKLEQTPCSLHKQPGHVSMHKVSLVSAHWRR